MYWCPPAAAYDTLSLANHWYDWHAFLCPVLLITTLLVVTVMSSSADTEHDLMSEKSWWNMARGSKLTVFQFLPLLNISKGAQPSIQWTTVWCWTTFTYQVLENQRKTTEKQIDVLRQLLPCKLQLIYVGGTSTEFACNDSWSHLVMLAPSQGLIFHDATYFAGSLLRSCLSSLENQSLIKLNDTISWTAAKHKHTVMKITWKGFLWAHGISLFTN